MTRSWPCPSTVSTRKGFTKLSSAASKERTTSSSSVTSITADVSVAPAGASSSSLVTSNCPTVCLPTGLY